MKLLQWWAAAAHWEEDDHGDQLGPGAGHQPQLQHQVLHHLRQQPALGPRGGRVPRPGPGGNKLQVSRMWILSNSHCSINFNWLTQFYHCRVILIRLDSESTSVRMTASKHPVREGSETVYAINCWLETFITFNHTSQTYNLKVRTDF